MKKLAGRLPMKNRKGQFMKIRLHLLIVVSSFCRAAPAFGATHHVNLNSTNPTPRFQGPILSACLGLWLLLMGREAGAQGIGMQAQIPAAEYNALVDLYNATSGPNWADSSGWLNPQAVSWHGVTVTGGHVTYLVLDSNYLIGTIPDSLADLLQLQTLDLSENILSGTLPDSLGNLSQLKELDLRESWLSGNIPATLGNLSQLQELDLDGNQLSGGIPDTLGNLSRLHSLELSFNQLTGDIPDSLSSLSQVEYFELRDNQLSGSIPDSLGNLSQVEDFELKNNQLTGGIPASLGSLSQVQWFDLSDNQLSGGIPASLGNLSQVQYFYLSDNQLSGSIPDSLGSLSQVQYFDLSDNQLSGSIPDSLGSLSQVQYLDISDNQLTGGIPASLGSLSQAQWFDLSDNQLSGSIPVSLGNLRKLQVLDLDSNQLSGTIPDFSAPRDAAINVSINYLDVAMGSQSLLNVDATTAAGNTIIYLPQSSGPPPTGSLQVTIAPTTVVSAGARWQVDEGAYLDSGATVSGLAVGNHLLSFSAVNGWTTPADQTVAISNGMTTAAIGIYMPPFIYTTNNGAISIAGYSCSDGVVPVPNTIGSFPVTSIGSGAFANCTNLLMVTIPGSVASIEGSAFSGCSQLKTVLFEGNAPSAEASVLSGDADVIVYYLPGTTGWGSTFCGVGAVLWNPVACGPAVHDNRFAFSIIGTANIPVAIERCTDLAGGAWAIAQSGILTNGLLRFSDPSWTNDPCCFYRLCFPLPLP